MANIQYTMSGDRCRKNCGLVASCKVILSIKLKLKYLFMRISAKPDRHSGAGRTARIRSSERSDERVHLVDLLSAVNPDFSLRIDGPLISIL